MWADADLGYPSTKIARGRQRVHSREDIRMEAQPIIIDYLPRKQIAGSQRLVMATTRPLMTAEASLR
jgi:hypothetical protein